MNSLMYIMANVTADNAKVFFTMENLKAVFNQLIKWGVDLIIDIIIALIIWKVGKVLIKWSVRICDKALEKAGVDLGVNKFICSILRFGIYAIVIIIILDVLGIQTASLIAVFGSAALAISMSLQGSLSNFAGGILILLFKPFRIGDYIIVGSYEGTVVSIEILYTKVKTVDNKVIMMPNGALSNSNIVNVGIEGTRRLDMQIGIGYGSDVKQAKNILKGILENYPTVDKTKDIVVIVKDLDASCVTLETRVWVSQQDYWDTRFELLEMYKKEFDANGIEIPFNKLDVHMKQN